MLRLASLLIMIVWALEGQASNAARAYCAEKGLCDLSKMDWSEEPTLAIDTDWDFHWQKLLTPQDLEQKQHAPPQHMRLHERWNALQEFAGKDPHGFATYQLRLKLQPQQLYSLQFPELTAASRIWHNGTLIREFGRVGTERDEEVPSQRVFIHTFVAQELDTITIQTSNFSNYFNGARGSFRLGLPEAVSSAHAHDVMLDAIVFGCILIMAFYHLYLWYLRPHRFSPFYYAIFCLSLGLRSLIVGGGRLMSYIVPQISFEIQYKIEYATMGFAGMSLLMMIYTLYHREFTKRVCTILVGICGAMTLFIFLTSARIYPRFLPIFQLEILISNFFVIFAVFRAYQNKREGAGLFLLGFGFFFLAVLNDILLSNRVIQTFVMTHIGVFGFLLFQAMILSFRFDMAFDRAESAERESRRLNESLEIKVADRTREIQTILKHVKSGFLAVDRSGKILPGFTQSCFDLLNSEIRAGDSFLDVLASDRSSQSQFRMALDQVFEESLPIDVSLEQLQRRVAIQGKVISLSGSEIRDEASGRITAILLTINDATSLQLAEQKVGYNEMLIKIIQNKESFQLFLKDFWDDMRQAREACEKADQQHLRTLLHTMKGNLGAFGIEEAVKLIHVLENKETIRTPDVLSIETCMKSVQAACSRLLEFEDSQHKHYTIDQFEVSTLRQLIEGLKGEPVHARLLELLDHIPLNTARSYLGPIHQNVEQIANFLGKRIELEVSGDDVKIDSRYATVLRNLVHLVRNAADHGIEAPDERGDKDPQGRIRLQFAMTATEFIIKVEDDGRGLDFEKIRRKALEIGIQQASATGALADQDPSQLIFHPSFSTANELTEVSGRGVGLASVKEAVEKLGGRIEVVSRPQQGCSFTIILPLLPGRLHAA